MTTEEAIEILDRWGKSKGYTLPEHDEAMEMFRAALREVESLRTEIANLRDQQLEIGKNAVKKLNALQREVEQSRAAVEACDVINAHLNYGSTVRIIDASREYIMSWTITQGTIQAAILAAKGE